MSRHRAAVIISVSDRFLSTITTVATFGNCFPEQGQSQCLKSTLFSEVTHLYLACFDHDIRRQCTGLDLALPGMVTLAGYLPFTTKGSHNNVKW